MPAVIERDTVTLHLKTDRVVRDRLLGALRAEGTTMQGFFDTLMRTLVAHPERLATVQRLLSQDQPGDLALPPEDPRTFCPDVVDAALARR